MRKIISIVVLCIMLVAGVALAGSNGWQSDYETRWDITVLDSCKGVTTIYRDCYITNQGEYHVSFIPDQGRIGVTNGRVITATTLNSCTTFIRQEAD